jgi:hypothetical protein
MARAPSVVEERDLITVVRRRRGSRRSVAARVGGFSASDRRLDAVGGGIVGARPAGLLERIVWSEPAALTATQQRAEYILSTEAVSCSAGR